METDKQKRIKISRIKTSDVSQLVKIARHWIVSRGHVLEDEVEEVQRRFTDTANGDSSSTYLVAHHEGNAIGVVGFRVPEEQMEQYKSSPDSNSAELINFFVNPNSRGSGVGKALLFAAFEKAEDQGFEEMIWNSGPRYEKTAWGFYDHVVGDGTTPENNYYGPGAHARIWRKKLS
jgi:GNAT superfamily N-acetyltransferase